MVIVPNALPLDQAAAVARQGTTAHVLVRVATRVGADDVVVVHSAAGGTGSAVAALAAAVRTGGTRTVDWTCDVTWSDSGGQHSAAVDVGPTRFDAGQTVRLRVHGDIIAIETPVWAAVAMLVLGLVLLGAVVLIVVRARRARP